MGSGFRPLEAVSIFINWDESLQPLVGFTTADEGGAFMFTADATIVTAVAQITPTLVEADVVNLGAEGDKGSLASVPVKVVENAPTVGPGSVAANLIVVGTSGSNGMTPGMAEKGGEVTVLGSGFKKGEGFNIMVTAKGGKFVGFLGDGSAHASGAFSSEATVNLDAGLYSISAVGFANSLATAPLLRCVLILPSR